MNQPHGDVLLVGSVPRDTATEVFRTCSAALGSHLRALPDGEVGPRKSWIQCQAIFVFDGHPALETVKRPKSPDGIPQDYGDSWVFRIKAGSPTVDFDDLRYAEWAAESYQGFCDLRSQGEIPPSVRFQVSLPTPQGGCLAFFDQASDRELILGSYERAMIREVERICRQIPHHDLALQWDVCTEVLEIAGNLSFLPGEPLARAGAQFARLGASIPSEVLLGYHFCYGDLAHRHLVEPQDLSLSVQMANLAIARSSRRVHWVHMPVPISRLDDAYFAPLSGLQDRDTDVFLGLIHLHDGREGAMKRADVARRYLRSFGVATECGLGRRSPETLAEVLRIHRDVAEQLTSKERI